MTRLSKLLWPCLIAAACIALYAPFLDNPWVFDDRPFFSGRNFARYATTPFGLELRLPAYFSLAFVEVLWGGIRSHRLVTLALHAATALVLYKLILDLLRHAAPQANARLAAFCVSAAFAVHPVAVYGAGYLIQRTGLLSTLFALLSVLLFVRGVARRSHADAVSAAGLYALAVLSKETAVLLPAAALAGALALGPPTRFVLRHAAIYLGLCAPAAILVALLVKGKIGTAYEPDFASVAVQLGPSLSETVASPWLGSAMTQLELFFRYLALWLWPDTGAMSIDLRVDFASTGGWVGLLAFAGYAALCGYLISRGGRRAMAGLGLSYAAILFLAELSTVRFADPFVLYRSYLWAPGLAIALAAGLSRIPAGATLLVLAIALPLLLLQARDRLQSFSSGLAVWQDAVDKLPREPIPGGSRPLYQLGREYLYRGETDKALATAERCIAQYPATYECYLARAAIHVELEQHEAALPDIQRVLELRPDAGSARYLLGVALENLGSLEEAKANYRAAMKLGFPGAVYRLQSLEEPGKGLLPPTRSAAPPPG